MRTTLTLDDDLAAKLKAEQIRAGLPALQGGRQRDAAAGPAGRRAATRRQRFTVAARDLGALRPGLSLDDIGELIERTEGSLCSRGR